MCKILLSINLLFVFNCSIAQNSLKNIEIFNNRFEKRITVIEVLTKRLATANNEEKVLLYSLLSLSNNYLKNFEGIKHNLDKAEEIVPLNERSLSYAYYQYAKAKYFLMLDQNDKSLSHFLKSFDVFKLNNDYDRASEMAINISYIINNKTLKYLDFAKKSLPKIKDISNQINVLNAYATYLKEIGSANNKDSVLVYQKQGIDKITDESKVQNKMYLSSIYFNYGYNNLLWKNKETGKKYLNKALKIARKYNFVSIIRNYFGVQYQLLEKDNKPSEAKNMLEEGYKYIQTMPFKDALTEAQFITDLKAIAEKEKNFGDYYKWDLQLLTINEKVKKETIDKNIAISIATYENKEKEEKIQILSKQNTLKNILIGMIALIFVTAFIAFYYYHKSNKIKQKYLNDKKHKITAEKEQAQKELINSILHIEKKNEVLNELKRNLLQQKDSNHNYINESILKTINSGLNIDDDFEKFKNNLDSVYPEFFRKLQQKSNNKLTQLDLKYCSFILMRISNKEIANQMNIEPKSIRMARYRIKQKLSLSKENDLDQYIHNITL